MTEPFVLDLLPARGLDQSMLLPVLVGLLVVLFFTEVFGWVFAGAVVPGYLASVFVIQPVTGAIVVVESLATLALALAVARWLSRSDAWTRFFGRERFFLILALSLLVRMHSHAWFAPWAIGELDLILGTDLEPEQEFFSVGLVLVPLTANMLWKPRLARGLTQLGVEVGVTYLIVVWILLPYTNLSLSSVELTYENAAVNFVAHAKAHIILLCAAWLAAQFNLSYGWDFNGILVPALLALLWLTPLKLLATLVEAVIVLYLTRGFLALPGIRHLDFEGPRKIVVVFGLAFLWKLALGFSLSPIFPELKISDTYGFGYLLSSLLAVKMLGRKSLRGVLLPSVLASAGGFALGSLVGFGLDLVAPVEAPQRELVQLESTRLSRSPVGAAAVMHMEAAQGPSPEPASQAELDRLRRFWGGVERWSEGEAAGEGGPSSAELRSLGAELGLRVERVGDHRSGPTPRPGSIDARERRGWYAIVEQSPEHRRGWPGALIVPGAPGPVLVVPMPQSDGPVAEAAVVMCKRIECRAVLIAGREQARPGTIFQPRPLEQAIAAFAEHPKIILRADLAPDQAAQGGHLVTLNEGPGFVAPWPKYSLDYEHRPLSVELPDTDSSVVLARATPGLFEAEFVAGLADFDPPKRHAEAPQLGEALEPADLLAALERMREDREAPDRQGAAYRRPSAAELLVIEQQIVAPLLAWIDEPSAASIASIRAWARLIDYELVGFGDCELDEPGGPPRSECLVMLRDLGAPISSGWGTLVLRPQAGEDLLLEVPRPNRELETWRVGAELWQASQGRALLIAGADGQPDAIAAQAGDDRREDALGLRPKLGPNPVLAGNLETPFQAMHQAVERSKAGGFEAPLVQVRGIASHRQVDAELVLGIGRPAPMDAGTCRDQLRDRLAALVAPWGRCQLADGSQELYLLTGAGVPQIEYSRELAHRELRVLWLSAGLRERFDDRQAPAHEANLRALGLELGPRSELEALVGELPIEGLPELEGPEELEQEEARAGVEGYEAAITEAVSFAETDNLHAIAALRARVEAAPDLRLEAGQGQDWGRPFLLIELVEDDAGRRALISLDHRLHGRRRLAWPALAEAGSAGLEAAALARPQVLEIDELPVFESGAQP